MLQENMSRIKCRELNQKELEQLKSIELNMLNDIHSVCEKNGIKYSLAAGTLLGAVRHGGFIPWDDDIDIMMPRKDYERFLEIGNEQLNKDYEIVTYKKYNGYGMPFAKVMKKNTKMIEINTRNINAPCGIFIDIFPIDMANANNSERKKTFDTVRYIKRNLLCRSKYAWDKGLVFDTLYKFKGVALNAIPKRLFINKLEKKIYMANMSESVCLISYCGDVPFERSSYPTEWFKEYIDISFEQFRFKIICGYKELLTLQYGDYMTLPPMEQRKPHHSVIEFKIS